MAAVMAALGLLGLSACGAERGVSANPPDGLVTIYSTTDRDVFGPVIGDFRALYPKVRINYVEMDAAPLFERFEREEQAHRPAADLVLSSAIDLQVKLVNDGYAQRHISAASRTLPPEAQWRSEIFGLTFEPVVFVVNTDRVPQADIPRSRFDLVRSLRQMPDFWRGRVGTYDVELSSVGYLLATQDSRQSSEFGALISTLGALKARTYGNMAALIDDLADGRAVLGYNVLASYARARIAEGAHLQIVYPEDYTLAVVRAAFISRDAPNPAGAHAFLEYLMSPRGQRTLATRSELSAASLQTIDRTGRAGVDTALVGPLRPIQIGPGLLTYLDAQKRERFLANWQAAFDHDPNANIRSSDRARQADDSFAQ